MNLAQRNRIKRALWPLFPLIQLVRRGTADPIHLWKEDPDFGRILPEIEAHTLVDPEACFVLFQLARHAVALPGDLVEVGVYRGGTARLISRATHSTNKLVHLFDTFTGMPEADAARDWHETGDFADTSLATVSAYLSDCRNARLYPGLFPESANSIRETSFCFAHVDVDIYASVRACCEFLIPRMVLGGIVVFDDYGHVTTRGAREAVDEYFASRSECPVYLPTGQCLVVTQRQGP